MKRSFVEYVKFKRYLLYAFLMLLSSPKNIFRLTKKIIIMLFMIVFYILFSWVTLSGYTGLLNTGGIPLFFIQFLFVCGFLLFFHLAVIDIKRYKRAWFEVIVFVFGLLQVVYIFSMPFGEEVYVSYRTFILLSIVIFHIGIIVLISEKRIMFRTRRFLSSRDIVFSGVTNFSLFIAISFSFLISGTWQRLPITCEKLYGSMGVFVQWLASPVLLGVEKTSGLATKIQNISQATLGDVIGVDDTKSALLSGYLQTLEDHKDIKKGGMLERLDKGKIFLLEEATDKTNINQGICEIIIKQIDKKANRSTFKYSVATLLFFLFYPLVRLFFFMVSVGSLILFKILHRSHLYVWKKVMKEVEEIE